MSIKIYFDDIAMMRYPLFPALCLVLMTLCSFMGSPAFAQQNRYVVTFTDKTASPFSLTAPLDYLSQRAVDRRVRNNIEITESDLPVNPSYLQAVREQGGIVLFSSRWFNATLVEAEPQVAETIRGLAMVKDVTLVAPSVLPSGSFGKPMDPSRHAEAARTALENDAQQVMIGIDQMHADGWRGRGVVVAVLDSGFPGVDDGEAFAHLRTESRILDSWNFAWQRRDVFGFDDHGTMVLSVMAAKLKDRYAGALPEASYLLYATEFVPAEYRVEEYNWLFAAERADSAGADVINTSLGYTTFDDPGMDYTYADLDGQTTVVTRAANMAAERGIVVVASAGNQGSGAWRYIGAPADGEHVLAVGAVDDQGKRSSFSSIGPSADGRTKPDVATMGFQTVLSADGQNVTRGSGTSFSAPLTTALAGGLLQSKPDLTAKEVVELVRSAGSQYTTPDDFVGYGIPSYQTIRLVTATTPEQPSDHFRVFPNPLAVGLTLNLTSSTALPIFVGSTLTDAQGRTFNLVWTSMDGGNLWKSEPVAYAPGLYVLNFSARHANGKRFSERIKLIIR